ncbi:hypothetical protein P3342_011328 [Pyrenophora teres f. teres]|nr:hypothetical protein P3342_011328 [Pyrenophora teres f. teres]
MFRFYSTVTRASIRHCPPLHSAISTPRVHRTSHSPIWRYYSTANSMSDLFVELTAPNGHKYRQPRGLFINNEFVKSKSGETITTINPSDESEIASVYAAGPEDVNDAVAAARKAFNDPSWRDMDTSDRGDLLYKFAELIDQHKETLATIETWDNGKPYSVALGDDLAGVVAVMKYYAGFANKIHGTVIDTSPRKLAYIVREPLGVCGQIIPWNFPLLMAAWKLGPALCTGNTIVMKAAEQTPLSILYLGTLIKEAGFPWRSQLSQRRWQKSWCDAGSTP